MSPNFPLDPEALLTGGVTASGEGYPTVNVNFGRDAGNIITLVGGAQGSSGTSDPLSDMADAAKLMRTKGHRAAHIVVMNSNTYDETYTDETGTEVDLIADGQVLMGSKAGVEGVRGYSAILDHGSMAATSRFHEI